MVRNATWSRAVSHTTSDSRRALLRASLAVLLTLCGSGFASGPLAMVNTQAEEGSGFQSNHLFLNGPGGDSISPFSGDLELAIPIGPTLKAGGGLELGLSLHYSSKIWRVWSGTGDRFLKGRSPFGVGWRLHVGRVYIDCRNGCNYTGGNLGDKPWVYESPDGAAHPIAYGVMSGGQTYDGTTDSTFIRVEALDAMGEVLPATSNVTLVVGWRLFMGNGVVHIFERRLQDAGDDFNGWYTTRIERWDFPLHPVARIQITYDSGSQAHCLSSITYYGPEEFTTPQRSITFVNDTMLGAMPVEGGYTKEIRVPALDGQLPATAAYRFEYSGPHTMTFHIDPNRPDLNKEYPGHFLLSAVRFPSPGQGQPDLPPMTFSYDLDPSDDGTTGELIRRVLPTGAAVQYYYDRYAYNVTPLDSIALREVVKKKVFLNAASDPNSQPDILPNSSNPGGVWTYARARYGGAHSLFARITDPFVNDTVYLFGQHECDPLECPEWTAGLVTSVKMFDGEASWRYEGLDYPQEGVIVRTQRTRYSADDSTGRNIVPSNDWSVDEVGNQLGTRRLERGPFGHFRVEETYGSGVPTRRTSLTYEEAPPGGLRWRLWYLNTVVDERLSEGEGPALRKTTRTYTLDGRPLTETAFADPTGSDEAAPENLVTQYVYDPASLNLERSYTHKAGAASPAYGTRLEYDPGGVLLKTTRWLDPNNATAPASQAFTWVNRDLIRESTSGAVIATIDPAGIRTDLKFDAMSRLIAIDPNGSEKPTRISYPGIRETHVSKGDDPNSSAFIQSKYLYDTLGRLVEVRRRTETGCEAIQKTRYDIVGRTEFVSEWGFDSQCSEAQLAGQAPFNDLSTPGTTFFYHTEQGGGRRYDPLGRLLKVTTADGKSSTAAYTGSGVTVTIGEVSSHVAVSTYYERDLYGNLVQADAPDGADARYTYSPLGELKQVELSWVDPNQVLRIQPRSFLYDGLGRLLSSTNPETGTVQFSRYDAVGRLLEKLDSDGTKFGFSYDPAGRILTATAAEDITPASVPPSSPRTYASMRTLSQYFYDEAGAGSSAGRLTRLDSYDESGQLVARRKLVYSGLNGRLSEELDSFALWDGREGIQTGYDKEFRTCYVYDPDLGLFAEMRYPAEATCVVGSAPPDIARLTYGHRNGTLNSIRDATRNIDLINSLLYNAAGGVRRIAHGNGTTTDILPDLMHRVDSIAVTPAVGPALWQTGQYAYDGVSNITSIGDPADPNRDTFIYDRLSRLTDARMHYVENDVPRLIREMYTYDGFGNLTEKVKRPQDDAALESRTLLPATPATNRLAAVNASAVRYDHRGNLLNDDTRRYLFDERNRLLVAGDIDKTYPVGLYNYDASGLRLMKQDPGTGERTFYVRDTAGNVLTELTVPPKKYDEYYQKDYFHALGRVLGMAEEAGPAPAQGLISSVIFHPGEVSPAYGDVTLKWIANPESDVTTYRVFRRCVNETLWQQVGSVVSSPAPVFTESVVGFEVEWECFYRVAAVRSTSQGLLEGIPSRTLRVLINEPEPFTNLPPQGLTLERHDRSLTLRWVPAPADTAYLPEGLPESAFLGYNVYRAVNGVWWLLPRNQLPLTDHFFHDLQAEDTTKTYQYQVRRVDTTGSESAGAITGTGSPGDDAPPAPPAGVRALSGPGLNQVTVVWSPSAEPDLASYKVYRKDGGFYTLVTECSNLSPSVRECPAPAPQSAQLYTFAVTARDAVSESALSADASARTRGDLETPALQTAGRELSWIDSSARVQLSWNATNAARYKIYRKLDQEPWSAYRFIAATTQLTYMDTLIDRCAAYTYMIRTENADGHESPDPVEEVFVERSFRPLPPTAQILPNNSIRLTWSNIDGCQAAHDGFEVVGWEVYANCVTELGCSPNDPNAIGLVFSSGPTVKEREFTGLSPTRVYGFAVVAVVRNNYHDALGDELREFRPHPSEDLCVNTTVSEPLDDGPGCLDVSDNDPPTSTGGDGGGGTKHEWQLLHAKRLVPHWHGPLARLSLPQTDAAERIAAAPGSPHATLPGPETLLAPRNLGFPSQHTAAVTSPLLQRDPYPSRGYPIPSPHRVIGLPSPKAFHFSYFHHDHLGSVRLVSDPDGASVSTSKYLPFGEEATGPPPSNNSHRFTGHERDSESGLDYMVARYYSRRLGRFLTRDPIDSSSQYSYVHGNPISYHDPLGLASSYGPLQHSIDPFGPTTGWDSKPYFGPRDYCNGAPLCSSGASQSETSTSDSASDDTSDSGDGTNDTGDGPKDLPDLEDPAKPRDRGFLEWVLVTAVGGRAGVQDRIPNPRQIPWQFSAVGPRYGPLAINLTFLPATGDLWIAPGAGVTAPLPVSFTVGPLFGGDLGHAEEILTGWGWGADLMAPGAGAAFNSNRAGTIGGIAAGGPFGPSVSYTYGIRINAITAYIRLRRMYPF